MKGEGEGRAVNRQNGVKAEAWMSNFYLGHSLGYGEMSRVSLSKIFNVLFEGLTNIRFLDIGSGSGRPTLHAAFEFADIVSISSGIEIGFHRFIVSLDILDHVRETLKLPLTHLNYLHGDACDDTVINFNDFDCFFFYDAVITIDDKAKIFAKLAQVKHNIRLFCCTSPDEMKGSGVMSFVLKSKLQTKGLSGKNAFTGYLYELTDESKRKAAKFERDFKQLSRPDLFGFNTNKFTPKTSDPKKNVSKRKIVEQEELKIIIPDKVIKPTKIPKSSPTNSVLSHKRSPPTRSPPAHHARLSSRYGVPPESFLPPDTLIITDKCYSLDDILTKMDVTLVSEAMYHLLAIFTESDKSKLSFSESIHIKYKTHNIEIANASWSKVPRDELKPVTERYLLSVVANDFVPSDSIISSSSITLSMNFLSDHTSVISRGISVLLSNFCKYSSGKIDKPIAVTFMKYSFKISPPAT